MALEVSCSKLNNYVFERLQQFSPRTFSGIYATYENSVGHAVAQLVEALRYKSEGRRFDSRWCHWNFLLT